MYVYVDAKLIGRTNYDSLVSRYSNIDFVTEPYPKDKIEIMFSMPKVLQEMDLEEYPKLKWIQHLMAGYDSLNVKEFNERGIIFSNAQDIFSKSIAEDVFAKILYFNRNIIYYIDSMKEAKWEPIREEPEITNSRVLIFGVGSIGKELAKRLKAFEAFVVGYRTQNINEENFDLIITEDSDLNIELTKADYVILALPLNNYTYQMFDAKKFDLMKKSSLFINIARGKIVNQNDLINALKTNKIRGAGLDVFDPEPLPKDSELWKLDNVYITPHNASSSPFMRDRLYEMIVMNLDLYLQNEEVKYQIKA